MAIKPNRRPVIALDEYDPSRLADFERCAARAVRASRRFAADYSAAPTARRATGNSGPFRENVPDNLVRNAHCHAERHNPSAPLRMPIAAVRRPICGRPLLENLRRVIRHSRLRGPEKTILSPVSARLRHPQPYRRHDDGSRVREARLDLERHDPFGNYIFDSQSRFERGCA